MYRDLETVAASIWMKLRTGVLGSASEAKDSLACHSADLCRGSKLATNPSPK